MDAGAADRSLTVLADPTRVRILRLIRDSGDGRVLVGRTAEALGVTQPTVSHHTRVLAEAGLITGDKRGRWVYWSVDPTRADFVRNVLGS